MSRKRQPRAPAGDPGHARLPVCVYKLGGPALEDPALVPPLAEELRGAAGPVLVVHGGGRHVERALRARGVESRFVEGRRETSPATMEVVESILSGSVNKALAADLTRAGVPAVGLSGRDAGLLRAEPVPGLGRVGERPRVDPAVVLALWNAGFVPVVSPVSNGPEGEPLNVNADEAALALARALFARTLVYFSDVDGVRVDEETAEELSREAAEARIADGTIGGGMALKVRTALEASQAGITEVVIAGRGRLTGAFAGTRIHSLALAEARP